MNRDHLLFLLIGLVTGFLGGYIGHEVMAGVQPAPLGAAAAADPHAEGAAPGGAQPQMADINRLREVLERDPENREALVTLANMNFDIGAWDRAQELYERYLRLDPSNPDVLTDLGISLRSQGRFDAALQRFREARAIRPDHWQALFNEVVVHAFDRSDFAAADTAMAELRSIAPGNPDVERLAEEVERRRAAG